MSAQDEMMTLISEQKIKVLEDVIEYAQRLIAMEQRMTAEHGQADNGPFWICKGCNKTSYGWKGDKHLCPHCGERELFAINQELYHGH